MITRLFDLSGRNRLFPWVASVAYTVRERRLHAFSLDERRRWVNSQGGRVLVSPGPHTMTVDAVLRAVRDHWCHAYTPKPGDTVIDLGAGIGEDTLLFSELVGSRGRVIAVEAHPGTAECLAATVQRSRLRNVTVLPVAITLQEGTIRIGSTDHHLGNSVMHGNAEGVPVQACRLDTLLSRQGVDEVDLLKVNIEGAEFDALTSLGNATRRIRHIAVSCHDFIADRDGKENLRTHARVKQWLGDSGFRISDRPTDPRPWVRYYLYGDRT
jgi:FkbM family methyltransferase